MNEKSIKRMQMQGYCCNNESQWVELDVLTRWTPLACATMGLIGILLQSPFYFIVLGSLTLIGGFTHRSFYDVLYNAVFKKFFRTASMPLHGNARRLGCGIGGTMYIIAGVGFLINAPGLAYVPSLMMIVLAGFAAVSHFCFASWIYNSVSNIITKKGWIKNPSATQHA